MLGTIKGNKLFPIHLIHLSWTVNLNFFPVITYMYVYLCLCFHSQSAVYSNIALPITVAFDRELGRARNDSSCTAGK